MNTQKVKYKRSDNANFSVMVQSIATPPTSSVPVDVNAPHTINPTATPPVITTAQPLTKGLKEKEAEELARQAALDYAFTLSKKPGALPYYLQY